MAAPKRNPKPATEPNLVCPFTGFEIKVSKVGETGFWHGSLATPLGSYTTALFKSRQELLYFLSMRDGVEPAFPRKIEITLKEDLGPVSDPNVDVKEREAELHEAVTEYVDRNTRPAGR